MFKRKLLACFLTLSLIAGALGGPAMANTMESSPQTASALSDNLATASEDQGLLLGLDASFSEVVTDSQEHPGSGGSAPSAPVVSTEGGGAENDGVVCSAQPVGEPEPVSNSVVGSSTAGSLYVPGPLIGMRPAPSTPCTTNGVILDISSNVDILVENQATAKTGTGTASGSNVENSTSGLSKAVALNDAGQEVAPSMTGAFADNSVVKAISNTGTATAATGLAEANNTSKDNTATVSPNTEVAVDVLGEIVDSTVVVKILYKYWAGITGLADATTGNGGASGLEASNSINSDDKAVAKGDAATVNGSGSYDGSALAVNESDNVIGNNGSALAASGKANADNTMLGNDIYIAPTIDTLIQFCGDIIRSNVTIELLYNFMATIAGQAVAQSGDTEAIGADVVNKIDNFTSSKAVGDAPTVAGAGGYSDGSAMAINDTKNGITNNGEAAAISGQAEALNTMLNNVILIAPAITSVLSLLESIIDSNVVIKITYNIWATIAGEAQAQTGDVSAAGVAADNSINNASSATALGDSAKLSSFGGAGSANGEAVALNSTANQIDNDGAGLSLSGDAKAANTMLDNVVNLSPVIDTIVIVVRKIEQENSVIIEIVYDIWATLTGSANAASGSATSYGAFGANVIDSSSDAYAVAKVTLTKPDGSATALNTSDNVIVNDGLGLASSGKADASSNISNAEVSLTGYLAERCYIGNDYSGPIGVSIGAAVKELADAKSGDAMAFGSKADSAMKSNAVSRDIFGSGGFSINDSDADIYNIGEGIAMTGSALAVSGKAAPNNTQNKIVIGFSPLNSRPNAAGAGSSAPVSGSGSPVAATASTADGQDSVYGDNNAGGDGGGGGRLSSGAAANGDASSFDAYKAAGVSWILGTDSLAWTADIAPYARAVKSYIDTKLYADISPIFSDAVALPWWLWVIFAGLLATSIRIGLRFKPKRR